MLSGSGAIYGIHLVGACIILAREIIVSGLREFLIMKDNFMIATSFSNNPILNPSLVKLYKADYDQILKNQPEFDINLINK